MPDPVEAPDAVRGVDGPGRAVRVGKLFGVLVTYRRPDELANTLESLARQTRRLDRLVVVDNDPPGGEACVAEYRSRGLDAEYVASPDNLGPAGGIAEGMGRVLSSASDEDWIVTLDDDDPPTSDTVLAELEAFAGDMLARDTRTGMVGLVGARFDWRLGRLVRLADRELRGPVAVDYIGGNHFPCVRAAAPRAVGPFRSALFFGFDDLEFGLRLRRRGYAVYADGRRWLRQRAGKGRLGLEVRPSARAVDAGWRRYYSLRNAIWILRSHRRSRTAFLVVLVHGVGKPLANLFRDPTTAVALLRMNWAACRDGWAGRLGRVVEPDETRRARRT
jgi:glycosyltransferase involved in cell wall biosynthesis